MRPFRAIGVLLSASALVFAFPMAASAATITLYNNLAAYLAATGSNALVDFESFPNGVTYEDGSFTNGGITFTQPESRMFVLGPSVYRTAGTTNYLNQNDSGSVSGIKETFATGGYGLGMEMVILEYWGG